MRLIQLRNERKRAITVMLRHEVWCKVGCHCETREVERVETDPATGRQGKRKELLRLPQTLTILGGQTITVRPEIKQLPEVQNALKRGLLREFK